MAVIAAVVGTSNKDDGVSHIVGSLLNGSMGLSTNIVTLEHLRDLMVISPYTGSNEDGNVPDAVIEENLQSVYRNIRSADTVVFGSFLTNCTLDERFSEFLEHLIRHRAQLCLARKKFVFVMGSDRVGSDVFDAINEIEDSLDDAGMRRVAQLIWIDDGSGKDADASLKNEAYLIGCTLRNNFLEYDKKKADHAD